HAGRIGHAGRVVRSSDANPVPENRTVSRNSDGQEVLGRPEKVGPVHDEGSCLCQRRNWFWLRDGFASGSSGLDCAQSATRCQDARTATRRQKLTTGWLGSRGPADNDEIRMTKAERNPN